MKPFLRALFAAVVAFVIFLLVRSRWHAVKSILVTLGYVMLLTVLFTPLCARLERAGIARRFAAGFAVLLVPLVLSLIILMFLPHFFSRLQELAGRCLPVLQAAVADMGGRLPHSGFGFLDLSALIDGAVAGLSKAAGILARRSLSMAAQAGRMLFSLIISYYILKERDIFGNNLLLFVPSGYRQDVLLAAKACKNAVMGYFCGMMKTGLFVGGATSAALFMLGIGDALLLGLVMGILEMVPYIGPILAAVPILLSALPLGIHRTMLSLLAMVLIQQVESNLIGPHFTASSTAIHPLLALLSTYVFGILFGFWGIVFAVPGVVMLRSILWSFTQFRNPAKA